MNLGGDKASGESEGEGAGVDCPPRADIGRRKEKKRWD